MRKYPFYQIDAFAERAFEGNPAAVMPMEEWLPDDVMQAIAIENNLSETAYFVAESGVYRIRWFTPGGEIDLCGPLAVSREGEDCVLDFPRRMPAVLPCPPGLEGALGTMPLGTWLARDLFALLPDEDAVRGLKPDMARIAGMEQAMVIVTAPGRDCGFVSRTFALRLGVPEDPVTGSTHCALVPFWSERLGKAKLEARQLSARGGRLSCRLEGDRVLMGGRAVKVLEGSFFV